MVATEEAGQGAAPRDARAISRARARVPARRDAQEAGGLGSILAAAMALPGVVGLTGAGLAPVVAQAQGKPDAATVGLRLLSYQDSQPGLKRISVTAPSFQVVAPLDEDWWIEGTLAHDSVSGASPRYHTAVSGASRMSDRRVGADVKVTRYFTQWSLAGSLAGSTERDYESLASSLEARWSSEDQNTSVNVAIGGAEDRINPVNQAVVDERRSTQQVSFGVTRATSRADLLQATLAYSDGRGYFSDPYKVLDVRPRARRQTTLLLRWNHHVDDWSTTLRTSYRAYVDSFGIQAHTVGLEWVAPLGRDFKVVPAVRLYTQTAADFYSEARYDPVRGEPFPVGYDPANPPRYITQDQRLSSFGAITLSLGFAYTLEREWTIDGKIEAYEQRGRWAWDGDGSTGLAPFRARSLQVGLTRRF